MVGLPGCSPVRLFCRHAIPFCLPSRSPRPPLGVCVFRRLRERLAASFRLAVRSRSVFGVAGSAVCEWRRGASVRPRRYNSGALSPFSAAAPPLVDSWRWRDVSDRIRRAARKCFHLDTSARKHSAPVNRAPSGGAGAARVLFGSMLGPADCHGRAGAAGHTGKQTGEPRPADRQQPVSRLNGDAEQPATECR